MRVRGHHATKLLRLDHRLVRLLEDLGEDPAEVADRLVVVERQRERDPPAHPGLMLNTPPAGI